MTEKEPAGYFDNFLKDWIKKQYIAKGVEEKKADELTKQSIEILQADIPLGEQDKRLRQLDRENKVPEVQPTRTGFINRTSVFIVGPRGGTRPFPGPIYKK